MIVSGTTTPPGSEMDGSQRALYGRIQSFQLDRADARFTFTERLAAENGWSLGYARRAIEEYKRFTFLAVAAGHTVTPSDAIDQVWHLHLSYTRSYWGEFCQEILPAPLHHEPTRGGLSERLKHAEQYGQTLESYQRFFGHQPPSDIWPTLKNRFDPKTRFVRINTGGNWIVPKPAGPALPILFRKRGASWAFIFIISAGFVTGCETISRLGDPLNLAGPEFLTVYFCLSLVFVYLALRLRHYLRLPVPPRTMVPVSLDPYEAAYLAGGTTRVVDTAIVTLVQKGYASVGMDGRTLTLTGATEDLSSDVERVVAESIASMGQINQIRVSLLNSGLGEETRSHHPELFVSPEVAAKAQAYPALLLLPLLALGVAKIFVGLSREKPIGILVFFCLILGLIALGLWKYPVSRSRYGDRVFQNLRTRFGSFRSTPGDDLDPNLSLAVAVSGALVLSGDILGGLGKSFGVTASGNGGSGGGSGGGCGGGDGGGGGGCGGDGGGGGCGGCGGCGG